MNLKKIIRSLRLAKDAFNGERLYLVWPGLYVQNPSTKPVLFSNVDETILTTKLLNDELQLLLASISRACEQGTLEHIDIADVKWTTDARGIDRDPHKVKLQWSEFASRATAYGRRGDILSAIYQFRSVT